MTYNAVNQGALQHGLFIMGALHPRQVYGPDDEVGTLLLLGTGAGFWPIFSRSEEYCDGQKDPLDRWSKRVIGALQMAHGATAGSFPSDGPPYPPFIDWALKSGRFHSSPVGMMVHDSAGLMVSLRGALLFDHAFEIPAATAGSPCDSCAGQPCRNICPVEALGATYDVAACKPWVTADCLHRGCLARRACPLSKSHGRLDAQSAFHMKAFITP